MSVLRDFNLVSEAGRIFRCNPTFFHPWLPTAFLFPLGAPPLKRPLLCISNMLSLCVPRRRCSGFIQRGLSHMCITTKERSASWLSRKYMALCARVPTPSTVIHPYPALFCLPVQFQHPVTGSTTYFFNLTASGDLLPLSWHNLHPVLWPRVSCLLVASNVAPTVAHTFPKRTAFVVCTGLSNNS